MTRKFTIEFEIDPEQHARTAQRQRELAREIADRIQRGESLADLDKIKRGFAANILRAWAHNLPDKPKRKRGRPASKLDAGNVALHYAALVDDGMKPSVAMNRLAEVYDVNVESIRNAVKHYGAAALAILGVPEQRKKGRRANSK